MLFRMANAIRNKYFTNALTQLNQINPGIRSRSIIISHGSCHQYHNRPKSSPRSDGTSAAVNSYLTEWRRSDCVNETVKMVLSSSNANIRIGNLPHRNQMSCDDLIAILIACDNAGLPIHCRIVQSLVEDILEQFKNDPQAMSLHGMANFALFANYKRDCLNKYLLCVDMFNPLLQRLAICEDSEEMHYITVCLTNLNRLMTKNSFQLYKTKLEELMTKEILNKDTDKAIILKILRFLNFAPWSLKNGPMICSTLELILSRVEQLTDYELAETVDMYRIRLEPGKAIVPILQVAESRIEKSSATHNIALLYCCSLTKIPEKNKRIIEYIDAYLDTGPSDVINDGFLFQILRQNILSSRNEYDKYWSIVATELAAMDPDRMPNFDNMLMKVCYRYSHFDGNQRGQYRHLQFEKVAVKLAIDEIETGISGMIPRNFIRLASFLLGYASRQTTHRFPKNFLQQIEEMKRQYTVYDILQLSQGVEAFHMRWNHKCSQSVKDRITSNFRNQICHVENILDEFTERFVASRFTNVTNINRLLHIYSTSRMSKRTDILNALIKSVEEGASSDSFVLSSHVIRDMSNNLRKINFMTPNICDKILRYLYENRTRVCGDIVGRTLYTLYTLGYEPCAKEFIPEHNNHSTPLQCQQICFKDFGAIIERDFELIPGLTIVRACLALVFYQALSVELIRRIFNLDFLMRLESEISICQANAPYASRSLNYMMQLNRAVCFGYPEARIPWFQQSYVEAHIVSISSPNVKFHEDILKILLLCIGDKSLIETDHVTPYGYRIPFVLYFNSNREAVRPPIQKNTHELAKFAIIPLENSSYGYNTKVPRGEVQLLERHLGILGFNVIQICYGDWNGMHMTCPEAKQSYLRKLLKIV